MQQFQIYILEFELNFLLNSCLITVGVRLVRTIDRDANVLGLFGRKNSELGTEGTKVETGNLFVQILGENVDLSGGVLASLSLVPEFQLCEDLVGEGGGHDERRVTSSTSQVEKTSFSEDNDSLSAGEDELVDLGLDVDALARGHKTVHVDFVIEVTNVSNNSVVLHLGHALLHEDSLVTSGGNKDISLVDNIFKGAHGESLHTGLKGADGVNLSDVNDAAACTHGGGTSLTNITVSADNGLLSGKHDISGTHDSIRKGVLASVKVVELGLGDGVVHVDSSEEKGSGLLHGVKSVDTGGSLLRDTLAARSDLVPLVGLSALKETLDDSEDDLELGIVGGGRVRDSSVLEEKVFSLLSLVDEKSHITTVVDDEVRSMALAIILGPGEGVQGALPVFLEGLSLPGEDSGRLVTGDGSGGVVLGGKDVARAPTHITTKVLEGLDQDGSLDGHVKGSRDTGIL